MSRLGFVLYVVLVTQQMQFAASVGTENTQFLDSNGPRGPRKGLSGEALVQKSSVDSVVTDIEKTLFEGEGDEADKNKGLTDAEKTAALKRKGENQKEIIKQWFTWRFWRLITMCAITLVLFIEVIFPLTFWVLPHTLLVGSIVFLVEMLSFLIVGCMYADAHAAGSAHTLVLATVMCAIGVLTVLAALSLKFSKTTKSQDIVADDFAKVFKPISYFTLIFLIVHGVLSSTSSDWGNVAVLISMMTLGIAIGVSGIVADMMAYIFIRANEYFQEGDFIHHGGGLVQVKHIYWVYTHAYNPKTRSDMFIPNGKLQGDGVCNQSRDNARTFDHEVSIPDLDAAGTEKFIAEAWTLLAKLEEEGFTSTNGTKFECLVDTKKSSVYMTGPGSLHFKLFGKYYLSKPPKWQKNSAEPIPEARQMEWAAPWNYQMEWFILEMKTMSKKYSK